MMVSYIILPRFSNQTQTCLSLHDLAIAPDFSESSVLRDYKNYIIEKWHPKSSKESSLSSTRLLLTVCLLISSLSRIAARFAFLVAPRLNRKGGNDSPSSSWPMMVLALPRAINCSTAQSRRLSLLHSDPNMKSGHSKAGWTTFFSPSTTSPKLLCKFCHVSSRAISVVSECGKCHHTTRWR